MSRPALWLVLAMALLPVQATAQQVGAASEAMTLSASFADAPSQRNAVAAGVLSWLVPGSGSFYAGNSGRGTLHLGIHLASLAVMLLAPDDSTEDAESARRCTPRCSRFAGAAYLILAANDVWSVVSAVRDVNAHNRGGTSTASALGMPASPRGARVTLARVRF